MSRQIKFRIFADGRFWYWGFMDKGFYGVPTGGSLKLKNAEEKSEQYTGLKDKNGREIYEGDILGGILGCAVEWIPEEGRWGFNIDGEKREVYFYELKQEDLEIIGNVHENKDLLNV